MKRKFSVLPAPPLITEDDIRSYAYQLYAQGNYQSGHDLAHWFEAAAFLHTYPTGTSPHFAPISRKD